jgi:hypothetical protein
VNGSITLLLATGGNVVVDLMGQFVATPAGQAAGDGTAGATAVSGGRYVPVDPVRVLDTRPDTSGPVPTGWIPHKPGARATVPVTGLPTGAARSSST